MRIYKSDSEHKRVLKEYLKYLRYIEDYSEDMDEPDFDFMKDDPIENELREYYLNEFYNLLDDNSFKMELENAYKNFYN